MMPSGTKVCCRCKAEKDVSEFGAEKAKKDGLCPRCKACDRARNRKYYEDNKGKILPKKSEYKKARYWSGDRDRQLAKHRRDYVKDPESYRARSRRRYWGNREKVLAEQAAYVKRNRARISRRHLQYYHCCLKHRPEFKASTALRSLLRNSLRRLGLPKETRTVDALGYSVEKLKERIECQFQHGMSWDNYGEWHIDHKLPVSHFVKKGENRPHVVNALCNLQPLWAADNISKGGSHPLLGS